MADKIKIVLAAALVVVGIGGFYYLGDLPAIARVASVLIDMAAAAAVFWTTDPGKQFYAYSQESVAETKKVVWPTRKETMQTTGIVFVFVVVMAIFLWAVDSILLLILEKFLGTGQ